MEIKPFPVLGEHQLNNQWRVICSEIYLEHIKVNENSLDLVISLGESQQREFRWNVDIGTIQFFVGVYPKKKTIRLASKNLNKELNLLSFQGKELSSDLKNHINELMDIPLENSPSIIESLMVKHDLPSFEAEEFIPVINKTEKMMRLLANSISEYRAVCLLS